MQLSVVIPTSRRTKALRETLLSCVNQELSGKECEVIVVANPPDGEVQSLVNSIPVPSEGPQLRLVENAEVGANKARNRGVEAAAGEIIYFLDDDCMPPHRGHFDEVVSAHLKEPELAGIGGNYLNPELCSRACQFYNAMIDLWLDSNQTEEGDQLSLLGGNAAYKRNVFGDNVRFDERLAYGGTETEFNHRLVQKGYKLKLKRGLSVIHNFGGSWTSLIWRAWKQGGGKAKNPHDATVSAQKHRRRPTLETTPRPRFLFTFFLALYCAVGKAGYLYERWRRLLKHAEG